MRAIQTTSLLLFVLVSGTFAQTNEATATTNSPVAYVYVGQNTNSTHPEISAFSVHSSGSVQTVSGSPFVGPSQNIVVSSGYVFGTDGTNIVVYKRLANGALARSSSTNGVAHNDTPQDSAVSSMTLDRTASSLYTVEINFQGADNDAYAEFANLHNGAIAFRTNSEISADFFSPLQFSENDQFAYGIGCFFADWNLFAFHRASDGRLIPFDPGNTFPPNSNNDLLCPSSAAASAKGFLAVAYGVANVGSKQNILTYRITSTGGLETMAKSVTATNFTGMSVHFDPTGNFLAAAGQNGIEVFRLNSNGTLTRLGSVLEPGVTFWDVKWDDSLHVYAISSAALYVFTLHATGLTLTGSPHPVANAGSLAVLPTL